MDYARVLKYRQRRLFIQKTRLYLYRAFFLLLLVVLWCNPYRPLITQHIGALVGECIGVVDPALIINHAAPVMAWSLHCPETPFSAETALMALATVTGIAVKEPSDILTSQIPLMADMQYQTAQQPIEKTAGPAPEPADKSADKPAAALAGPPQVALYNTHTGESYALTDGVERLDGKRGGIVKVTEALQQALEQQYHIKTVYIDKIHDRVYNKSYLESEKTVQQLLAEYPELKLILDIHRDSKRPRQDSFVEIDGQKVARIMIVVGSDARAEFPNWQQNLLLARQITKKLDEKYPGLSYGVRVQQGRYNQHYHSGALLFEIGSVENSTDEAIRAARLLAGVLAEILSDQTLES